MVIPLHRVDIFTGTKSGIAIDSAQEYADLIHRAKRPLLVVGPLLLASTADGKILMGKFLWAMPWT